MVRKVVGMVKVRLTLADGQVLEFDNVLIGGLEVDDGSGLVVLDFDHAVLGLTLRVRRLQGVKGRLILDFNLESPCAYSDAMCVRMETTSMADLLWNDTEGIKNSDAFGLSLPKTGFVVFSPVEVPDELLSKTRD